MRFPDDVPVLEAGALRLRPHRPDDLERAYEQCIDPETQRFTRVPTPYTRADAAEFLAGRAAVWEDGLGYSFALEATEGDLADRFAGSIGLRWVGSGIAEIGYGAHPAARGRGLTTVAVGTLLDWAFAQGGLHTVVWRCAVGNIGSWRVAWRNGFSFEGVSRGTLPHGERGEDCWTGALLVDDSREPKTRWLPHRVVAGAHVTLRPAAADDAQAFVETVLDPTSLQWLHEIPLPRDAIAFRRRVDNRGLMPSLERAVEWTIADTRTDGYLGSVGLFGFDGLDHASAEIGYRLHPSARGRGLVTEAISLALGEAFRPADDGGFGLRRISLNAGAGNAGSQAVARRCGFTETGRDRSCYLLHDGTVDDLIRFDLLAGEWGR